MSFRHRPTAARSSAAKPLACAQRALPVHGALRTLFAAVALMATILVSEPAWPVEEAERAVGKVAATASAVPQAYSPGELRLRAWRILLDELQGVAPQEQVRRVNEFFNAGVRYATDQQAWGVEDYWATPEELLRSGQGDCEDFALAKYVSLRELGVPEHQLHLAYVLHRPEGAPGPVRPHVVLTWDPQGLWRDPGGRWVLDNLAATIATSAQRTDLEEVLRFNRQWIILERSGQRLRQRGFLRWDGFVQRLDAGRSLTLLDTAR